MKNKFYFIAIVLVCLLVASVVLLGAPDVLARAGGGQNFSSGSSGFSSGFSSGSSFDSGSSDSSSVGFVPIVCGGGGWSWLIIIALFIIVPLIIKRVRKNRGGMMPPIPGITTPAAGGAAMAGIASVPAELQKLKQKDPNFNEQAFKDYVENAFFKIQEAWETQNLEISRPYVTEKIMQRYSTQLADLKSRGEKNILENIVIGHQQIVGIRSDAQYDYITVKLDASMSDYTTNAEGKKISGDKKIRPFTEFWTLLRKGTVKSDAKKGAQANSCPNCAAPLKLNATGKCEYCNAIVTTGDYDWVLSEIEQSH